MCSRWEKWEYPPFTHMVLIVIRSAHQQRAEFSAQTLHRRLNAELPASVTLSEPAPAPLEKSALPVLEWVKSMLSKEAEDACAVVLEAPAAAGVGFEGLDGSVEGFAQRVGDPVADVAEQAVQVGAQGAGHFLDRLQAAPHRGAAGPARAPRPAP
jgi:hypothetical protein